MKADNHLQMEASIATLTRRVEECEQRLNEVNPERTVLTARSIVLTNDDESVKGELRVEGDGVELILRGGDDGPGFVARATNDEAVFGLLDQHAPRIMSSAGQEEPNLHLNDKSGRPRMQLALGPDGQAGLILYSESHEPQIALNVDDNGPRIAAFDEGGTGRLIQGSQRGHGFLRILDREGNDILSVGTRSKDRSYVPEERGATVFYSTDFHFASLLDLATSFGWRPVGTRPPTDPFPMRILRLDPEGDLISRCREHEVLGGYFQKDGSVVSQQDAENLAGALESALDDLPNHDCLKSREDGESYLLAEEARTTPLTEWFSGRMKESVNEIIEFCRAGEFALY